MADQSLIQGAGALAKAESAMSLAGISGAAQAGANISKAAMFIAADLEKKAKEEELKNKNLQGVATSVKNKMTVGSKTGIFEDQITEEAKSYRLEVDKIATDKSLSFDERERQIRSKLDEFNVSTGRYGEILQLYGNIVDAGELGNFSNLMDKDSVLELLNASNEGRIKGTKEGIYIYTDEKKEGEPLKIITFDELKSDKYKVVQKNTREIEDFVNSAYQKGARAQNEKQKEGAIESLINSFTIDQKERILNDSFAAGKYLDKGDNTEVAFRAYATELVNAQYSPPETQAIGLDENAQIGANIINQASTIDGLMGVIGQSLRSYDYQLLDNETIGFRSGVDKDGNILYSDTIKINTPEGRAQAIFKALDNNPFLTGATKSDIWKYITSNGITITEEDKPKAGNENTVLEQTGYPDVIKNASEENIGITKVKELLGFTNTSIPNPVKTLIKNDYKNIYSEKNVREAMWDLDIDKIDKFGNKLGKSSLVELKAKEEKIQALMDAVTQASNDVLTFEERSNIKNSDKEDLIEFGIVEQIQGVTKKDLAMLEYIKGAGFKSKIEAETALASIDTGELPINNKL